MTLPFVPEENADLFMEIDRRIADLEGKVGRGLSHNDLTDTDDHKRFLKDDGSVPVKGSLDFSRTGEIRNARNPILGVDIFSGSVFVDTQINQFTTDTSQIDHSQLNNVTPWSSTGHSVGACDVVRTPKTAASMTVTTGTLSSGTVTDTQTWGDGNSVNVSEVTGVPGFDVLFTFTSVTDFCFIGISGYYDGTHHAEIQIFDDANSTWRVLWTFGDGAGFNYRFSDLPVSEATRADYINGSSEVKIRFYHPTTGNASHDLFIDYVSIIG